MGYPRKLLGPGEEIVLDFNPHWTFLFKPIAWTALWLLVLGGGLYLLYNQFDQDGAIPGLIFGLVVLIAWCITAGYRILQWKTTEYVLTTDRLIVRMGIIAKQGNEIPLERINNIAFSQSVLERMFGAGDLIIESAGEHGQSIYSDIPKPQLVQNEIYRQVEQNQARQFQQMGAAASSNNPPQYAPPQAPAPSVAQQIEDLARLRDRGIISPEEFEAKKTELLGRL